MSFKDVDGMITMLMSSRQKQQQKTAAKTAASSMLFCVNKCTRLVKKLLTILTCYESLIELFDLKMKKHQLYQGRKPQV